MNVQDATREEFIRFFNTDASGKSCRGYFERWLWKKRFDDITERLDEAEKIEKDIEKDIVRLEKKQNEMLYK